MKVVLAKPLKTQGICSIIYTVCLDFDYNTTHPALKRWSRKAVCAD